MYEVSDKIYLAATLEEATDNIPAIIQISEQPLFERSSIFIPIESHLPPIFDCTYRNAPEMYKCTECGFEVYLKVNLKVHMEMVHQLKISITLENFRSFSDECYNLSNILKCYNCKDCNFTTYSVLVLLKHQLKHRFQTRPKRYSMNHVRSDHFDQENVEGFKCDQCPMKTKYKKALLKHVQFVHSRRRCTNRYTCELCPFESMYKANWRMHMSCQHAESIEIRVFLCSMCPYRAKQKKHLESHMIARHTAPEYVKWYKCDHCSYQAKQKYTLNAHVLTRHTESEKIKWLACEECSFKCKRRTELKRHMLRHSEHRPMLCEVCSAQFKCLGNLKQHIMCKHKMKL